MEEFEGVDVVGDAHGRDVEGERVIDNASQVVVRHVVAKESLGDLESYLLERERVDTVKKLSRERLDLFGHVESLVRGETTNNRLFERGEGSGMVGAVVFQVISFFIC